MERDPGLTEQEKLDRVAERIFSTQKTDEDPPTPSKEDLERSFRISFQDGQPVFKEVMDE